jgi:hypothetical protein
VSASILKLQNAVVPENLIGAILEALEPGAERPARAVQRTLAIH